MSNLPWIFYYSLIPLIISYFNIFSFFYNPSPCSINNSLSSPNLSWNW